MAFTEETLHGKADGSAATGVEMLPGTEIMTDVAGSRRIIHDHGSHGSAILIPRPSSDPRDPLVCVRDIRDVTDAHKVHRIGPRNGSILSLQAKRPLSLSVRSERCQSRP